MLERLSGTSWVKAGTAELNERAWPTSRSPPRRAVLPIIYRAVAVKHSGKAGGQDRAGRLDAVGRPRLRRRVPGSQAGRRRGRTARPTTTRRPATLLQGLAQGGRGPPRRGAAERHGRQVQGRTGSAPPSAATARRSASSSTGSTGTSRPTASATLRYGVAAARMKFQKVTGQHASFWLQPDDYHRREERRRRAARRSTSIEWFGHPSRNGGLTSFVYHPTEEGPEEGRRLHPQPRAVPVEQVRRVVEEVPRVLGRVDAEGLHLPHRRQGDVAHDRRHLRASRSTPS